jgi:hypothetical protein
MDTDDYVEEIVDRGEDAESVWGCGYSHVVWSVVPDTLSKRPWMVLPKELGSIQLNVRHAWLGTSPLSAGSIFQPLSTNRLFSCNLPHHSIAKPICAPSFAL